MCVPHGKSELWFSPFFVITQRALFETSSTISLFETFDGVYFYIASEFNLDFLFESSK